MTAAMPDRAAAQSFDLNAIGQDFLDDPFPMYRALREHDPVHRNPDGTWLLTRYEDVVQSFKHPAMSSDKKVDFKPKFGDGPLYTHHTTSLVFNDPRSTPGCAGCSRRPSRRARSANWSR